MSYVPALDGVRALAVTAVLCFHGGVPFASGGFLGVDAFFVLSGYLITTLLLNERRQTQHIKVLAFWARRARRLLPALLAMVAAVTLAAPLLFPESDARSLRADAWSTLVYFNNWHMISGGSDYFAVTAAPSPLEHTWSLAIEEQFYLLWPLLLVLAFRWRITGRRLLAVCLLGAVASGIALAHLGDPMNPARGYYGTDTRGGSLLIGAALAIVLGEEGVASAFRRSAWLRRTLGVLALAAGVGLLWAWTHVSGDDTELYRGVVAALGVAVAIILAHVALVPGGLSARLLSTPPLPSLGLISYGVYLWHWPIFLAITSERSGLDGSALFVTRFLTTLAIATLSYVVIERPIRTAAWSRRPALALPGVGVSLASCALLVAMVPVLARPLDSGRASASQGGDDRGGLSELSSATSRSSITAPPPVVRPVNRHRRHRRPGQPVVADIFGDSMAMTLVRQLPAHPGLDIRDRTLVGCGITLKAPYRYYGHTYPTVWRSCRHWVRLWRLAIAHDDPDIVFILVGRWETMDRMFHGRWAHVGERSFNAYLRSRLRAAVGIAGARGARVVLATQPYNRRGEQADGSLFPEDVPARVDAWNRLLRDFAADDPRVVVADFGHLVTPGSSFTWTAGGIQMRTDGVHLAAAGVERRIAPWLFRLLLRRAPR